MLTRLLLIILLSVIDHPNPEHAHHGHAAFTAKARITCLIILVVALALRWAGDINNASILREYEWKASRQQVDGALRAMSNDPAALSRLAVISLITGHGEQTWVSEIAYQLGGARADVQLERALPARLVGTRYTVDLLVSGGAFEVKSSCCRYALKQSGTFGDTDKWIGNDVRKLRNGSCRGYVLITLATLIDAKHGLAQSELSTVSTGRVPRAADRIEALNYYREYGHRVEVMKIRYVDLDSGSVPNNGGIVQLDALLLYVHAGRPNLYDGTSLG